MIFNDREIQNYDLELYCNEITITSVEIDGGDVIDKVFEDFCGIEDEMTERYKDSWDNFTGDQLVEIKESLDKHLTKNYLTPTVVLNSIENASTQELLDAIKARLEA